MEPAMTTTLALLRHGQSEWNLQNRFTGWVDVDLSDEGRREARLAGRLLKRSGVEFERAYSSVLKRAVRTLWLALEEMDRMWLPYDVSWRLNERHYGALTGLDKAETAARHGAEQVKIWRRSYDTPPPPLPKDSPYAVHADARYRGVPVPDAESLKSTLERVVPYWREAIAPRIQRGENLLIAAHGNSLRALVKLLLDVSDKDIVGVEIPTGNPLLFEFERGSLKPTGARYLDEARAERLPF
jgi:2,3-bisphosphoglycerate-dependent phosphoglycerate mutase